MVVRNIGRINFSLHPNHRSVLRCVREWGYSTDKYRILGFSCLSKLISPSKPCLQSFAGRYDFFARVKWRINFSPSKGSANIQSIKKYCNVPLVVSSIMTEVFRYSTADWKVGIELTTFIGSETASSVPFKHICRCLRHMNIDDMIYIWNNALI